MGRPCLGSAYRLAQAAQDALCPALTPLPEMDNQRETKRGDTNQDAYDCKEPVNAVTARLP